MAETNVRKVGGITYELTEGSSIANTQADLPVETPEQIKDATRSVTSYLKRRLELSAKLAESERMERIILANIEAAKERTKREIKGLDYVFEPVAIKVCKAAGKGATKKYATPYGSVALNSQSSVKVTNEGDAKNSLKELGIDCIESVTVPATVVEKIVVSKISEDDRIKLAGRPGFNIRLPHTELTIKEQ